MKCQRLLIFSMGLVAPGALCLAVGVQGQTKSGASAKSSVVLVDTDDACRLTVDDIDEGVITPAQSKKVTVQPGDHVVKCVVESAPDLIWRKVVQAKATEQSAALVALKALHIQYDEAVQKAHAQEEAHTSITTASQGQPQSPTPNAQSGRATLADTMGFIQQKLNGQPESSWESSLPNCNFVTSDTVSDGTADPQACVVKFTFTVHEHTSCTNLRKDDRTTTVYVVSLRSLTDIQIKREQDEMDRSPEPMEVVLTGDSITARTQAMESHKGTYVLSKDSGVISAQLAVIPFDDATTAARVAKAIKYASSLCGSKPSPF